MRLSENNNNRKIILCLTKNTIPTFWNEIDSNYLFERTAIFKDFIYTLLFFLLLLSFSDQLTNTFLQEIT